MEKSKDKKKKTNDSVEWRVLEEFPDYEVSSEGEIRNINTGHYLRPAYHEDKGYCICNLANRRTKTRKTVAFHRLVAKSFLDNPCGWKYVLHLNGNRLDNRAGNLKWVSSLRKNSSISIEDEAEIKRRLLNGETGAALALEYNTSEMSISRIRKKLKKELKVNAELERQREEEQQQKQQNKE